MQAIIPDTLEGALILSLIDFVGSFFIIAASASGPVICKMTTFDPIRAAPALSGWAPAQSQTRGSNFHASRSLMTTGVTPVGSPKNAPACSAR